MIIDTSNTPILDCKNEFADLNSTNGFGELSSQAFAADLPTFNTQEPTYAFNSRERETTRIEENVTTPVENKSLDAVPNNSSEINVSQSFLQNLVGFLRTKVET